MSQEPTIQIPATEWGALKEKISHMTETMNSNFIAIREDNKEYSDRIHSDLEKLNTRFDSKVQDFETRIINLERWQSSKDGGERLQKFWIPMVVSAITAVIVKILPVK